MGADVKRVGVFDSGIGGLTVLAALEKRLPLLDYVYFGDNANLPYGTKSPEQVRRLCAKAAVFLKRQKIDFLVVACNTASSVALRTFKSAFPHLPILGMVQPGAMTAIDSATHQAGLNRRAPVPVAVFATRATIQSHAYSHALSSLAKKSGLKIAVKEIACPLLVPVIEEGWIDSEVLKSILKHYLAPLRRRGERAGIAVLGCTHYPWIQDSFQDLLPHWRIVNSASVVAELVAKKLESPAPPGKTTLRGLSRKIGRTKLCFSDPNAVPAFAMDIIRRRYSQ